MSDNLNKLRWQCRRGIKELDFVLCAYLDKHYLNASPAEQHLFVDLLAVEDDKLIAYFFSDSVPEQINMRNFVAELRTAFMC